MLDIAHDGLYSHFKNGSIIWEEVATEEPSLVVNGHIVAIWNIDQIIKRMSKGRAKTGLAYLNNLAKRAVMEFADQAQISDEDVVYDLRGPSELNVRKRGSYPWRIMTVGYRYLIEQGYDLKGALSKLETMKQAKH